MKTRQDLLEDIQKGLYKAAVFDIDGTLIDSMPIWEDLDADYLKTQGVELTEQEKQDLNEALWPMTVEEGIQHLKETYNLAPSEEDISKALSDAVEHFYRFEVPAKNGMPELVRALRAAGVPLALATVGEPVYETAALQRLGLFDDFQALFDCNGLGTTKREPVVFQTAPAALLGDGYDPADVLVFEDVLHAVRAAKDAGFTTVAVEDAASAKDRDAILALAHYSIHP